MASRNQYYGGWGHGAGVQVLTTLILARECGVAVGRGTYDRALTLFYRYAGHGNVPYGDHYPEMYWASNGKNGGLACALTLLPAQKFQDAAKILALSETDSYCSHEGGHGSPFGNQTWRGIADALVPEHLMGSYRRHITSSRPCATLT